MQQRALTIRLIWLAIGASVLLPVLLFSVASRINYRHIEDLTNERLVRSLDIEEEEANNAFLIVNHILGDARELVEGRSPDNIRANQSQLHGELKRLVADLPIVKAVGIYDKAGNLLVSSAAQPPPAADLANGELIGAHQNGDAATIYGRLDSSVMGEGPYFSASRAVDRDGALSTIVEATVTPMEFFRLYAALASSPGFQYALLRNDGLILARYPALPPNAPDRLGPATGFGRLIAVSPNGGFFTATSAIDGVERRYAVRRLTGLPVYVEAGIATGAIRQEWIGEMAPHLIFGVPATLLLFLTLLAVQRRTERLYSEIDQRALAEESLRQSQKMESIGQLTGGVAHDFNNLLTIILGNLEMAKRQLGEAVDPAQKKLEKRIESAVQAATRAATLTKRLLSFSRQQSLSPTLIDVNRILSGIADFLQRAIGEDVSLEIVGSAGLWPVEVDQTELEAAILNLAVNARDAMPDGGKLTIEASNSYLDDAYCRQNSEVRPGQYVQIAVTDTGGGMPKDVIDRAFEPFFTTKTAGQGTGLGLSQVYGFVKQSGGHVKIYSELGEGTSVKIYLRRRHGFQAAAEESSLPAAPGLAGETMLVAEDDPDVRAYVVESLETLGYRVLGAASAEEALRIFDSTQTIDLLLTDVVMPGANGRKLAEEAKLRRPGLKVLFMTGYSRNAIVHQGRLDPGVDLIQKPLTSEHLAAMVRKALDK